MATNPVSYLQAENITKSFGDLVLFENLSFGISAGQRVALIAKNGTGKTTLLNIINGTEDCDSGSVIFRNSLRISYLEQDPNYPPEITVIDACFLSDSEVLRTMARYEAFMMREELHQPHPEGETLEELLHLMDYC